MACRWHDTIGGIIPQDGTGKVCATYDIWGHRALEITTTNMKEKNEKEKKKKAKKQLTSQSPWLLLRLFYSFPLRYERTRRYKI